MPLATKAISIDWGNRIVIDLGTATDLTSLVVEEHVNLV